MYQLSPVAGSIPFDNDTNGFTATEVQAAIEEAKATAAGKLRDSRHFKMNGTVGNGNWVTIDELLPSYKYVFSQAVKMLGLEWANGNGSGRDFDLVFYKNGIDPANIFHTYEVRNSTYDYGYCFEGECVFAAGDWMRVKYVDQGDNVSDFGGRFIFEVL